MWSALYQRLIVRSGLGTQLSQFGAQVDEGESDTEDDDGIELMQRNQRGTEAEESVMTRAVDIEEVV